MTIADEIREENTVKHVRGLVEYGIDATVIAEAFELPVEKIEQIIEKLKEESN
jgi:predicted transcriptional regulator